MHFKNIRQNVKELVYNLNKKFAFTVKNSESQC